jgi:MFS family permease
MLRRNDSLRNSRARLATRLAFVAAGFGVACWAPLVPYAKTRAGVDEGRMGLLLLLLGAGSVIAMPLAGALSTRFGTKPIVLAGGIGLAVILPILGIAASPVLIGLALFLFGASLGSLDVAMNLHAVDVEREAGTPMMSGFHALFSIGGFVGSGIMTVLLSKHVSVNASTLLSSVILAAAILFAVPRLLSNKAAGDAPSFAVPKGVVLLIALFAAISFLVEGAVLDWSALLIIGARFVSSAKGGIGYMLFSIAMTGGRLIGDRAVAILGNRALLTVSGVTALLGFCVLLLLPIPPVAVSGFLLIGLGAANIVPILFRLAGNQTVMPRGLAVAALTTAGYSGMLAGPAGIGFLSRLTGLHTAFWVLAILLCPIPIFSRFLTAPRRV